MRIYDLISFNLEREIHTSAPFENFNNANATAIQIGTPGYPADPSVIQKQKKNMEKFNMVHYMRFRQNGLQLLPLQMVPK